MTGKVERWYPVAFSWLGVVVAFVVSWNIDITENQKLALLQSIISVAAILIGFLGTALAIVMSFYDRKIFRRLSDIGYDELLIDYLLQPIYGLFVVVLASIALLIWPSGWISSSITAILGFFSTFSLLAIHRLRAPLRGIIRNANDSTHED